MNATGLTTRAPVRVGPSRRQRRARRFERSSQPKRMQLTDRDIDVLDALSAHRFLSGEQLRLLVLGCGDSRARRRLRKLYDHGFIERISVVAQPTRGIPPLVYALSRDGTAALQESGRPAGGGGVNGSAARAARIGRS